MRDGAEEQEVTSLCTMALEVVTVLFNPDICLAPLQPVTQRVIDDCPSVKEVIRAGLQKSLHSMLLSSIDCKIPGRLNLNFLSFTCHSGPYEHIYKCMLCSLQAASLIAVLLPTLTQMAGNAHISKRIIASLAAHPSGRASLRLGCLRWQARSMGTPTQQSSKSAAQWAVTRLWQLGTYLPVHLPLPHPLSCSPFTTPNLLLRWSSTSPWS